MKTMTKLLLALALSVLLAACSAAPDAERTQNPEITEESTDTLDDTGAQTDAPAAGETTEEEATEVTEAADAETTAETTEETDAAQTEEAAQTEMESGRITNYEVDFSDVDGIRTMTAGEVDEELLVLAVISNEDEPEQEIAVYEVENGQKRSLFNFFIPQYLEFIGAVSGDDDEIHFTAIDRTDENTEGSFTVYRVDMDDREVHTLYEGVANELNYGHNLVADDDAVFFTENMWEEDGLYFADVVMVKDDAKQVINVEVFPSEHVSLLIDDDRLMYAAARDDKQYIVVYDYEDGEDSAEYPVAGDNANFRLTDYNDDVFLLDNYNGHPDMQSAMILHVYRSGGINALSAEGRNLHTALFADREDPDEDVIVAVSSSGSDLSWVEFDENGTGDIRGIAGDLSVPAGAALTGGYEDDDAVIRYPKPVSEDYYGHFTLVYQVHR